MFRTATATACLVVLAIVLVGCGSSKPAYCSKVSDLKTSVSDLTNVKVIQGGTNAVSSAIGKVKSDADAVISSAKSDFPDETKALSAAVDGLETSVRSLAGAPAATAKALPAQVVAATTAVQSFANATSSKCG